jgi:hypothetical protein
MLRMKIVFIAACVALSVSSLPVLDARQAATDPTSRETRIEQSQRSCKASNPTLSANLAPFLVGIPAALALTPLKRGVLADVATTEPWTYVAVVALLGAAALLASYLPARRATRVDPLVALRTD